MKLFKVCYRYRKCTAAPQSQRQKKGGNKLQPGWVTHLCAGNAGAV